MTFGCGFGSGVAEEIEVIEEHFHNEVICVGDDGATGFQKDGTTVWRLTANAALVAPNFGTAVQIYSGALGSSVFLDINRFFVTDVQANNQTYVIGMWAGSGAFGAATRATGVYARKASNVGSILPINANCPRIRGDLNIWLAVACSLANQWIDLLLEYHQYPPPNGDEITS